MKETNKISVTSCYTIAGASERCMTANRVNSTIQFTSVDWAVIADGTGWIYILQTGDRSHSPHNWKVNSLFFHLCFTLFMLVSQGPGSIA